MTTENSNSHAIKPSHSPNNHRSQPGDGTNFDRGEYTPYVRYAQTGDDGSPRQFHRLHPIDKPVPIDADFASPVYLLNGEQVERHEQLKGKDDRFRVADHTSIAIALQNECEETGQVLYPVFIESDAETKYYEMRAEIRRFIQEVLEVDPDDGRWYFSGGRSLHVHLPYYVGSETSLQRLRSEAEAFNEEADAPIDPSNYSRKSLFRLPGAEHHNTGIRKFPVAPDTPDEHLQAKIARAVADCREENQSHLRAEMGEFLRFCVAQRLELERSIPIPVVEQEEQPTTGTDRARWKQYNRHPFSPYANTGNKRRSVIVAQVKGRPYCRDTEAGGDIKKGIFVPAYIYGAVGAAGKYTIWGEYGRMRLSEIDYGKWDYDSGDTIVLLGGQSNSSRIIELDDTTERKLLMNQLRLCHVEADGEFDGRREAIETLRVFGYEVGSSGKNGADRRRVRRGGVKRERSSSRAYRLQKRAERDGVETLSHQERLHVANRLLDRRGWGGADEWFREQYGDRYDREITHTFLRSITEKYDDLPTPP